MKTKEELDALKAEVTAMHKKLTGLTDDELKQVVGGVSENGSANLQGIINGHLYDAMGIAKSAGNSTLITYITYMVMKNAEKNYAAIVETIDQLTAGVMDTSFKKVYDSLEQIKKAILDSGVLKA